MLHVARHSAQEVLNTAQESFREILTLSPFKDEETEALAQS